MGAALWPVWSNIVHKLNHFYLFDLGFRLVFILKIEGWTTMILDIDKSFKCASTKSVQCSFLSRDWRTTVVSLDKDLSTVKSWTLTHLVFGAHVFFKDKAKGTAMILDIEKSFKCATTEMQCSFRKWNWCTTVIGLVKYCPWTKLFLFVNVFLIWGFGFFSF